MASKPLPQLRKPSAASASAFVESEASGAPSETKSGPALEVVKTPKSRRTAVDPASKRRMTLYLSKATARALKLQAFNQERDMSEIVEEVLAKHLKTSAA